MAILERRYCWTGSNGVRYCDRDRWHDWGRWVAFAVIVGVALIAFFLIACFNARRRRRQGLRPIAGTAWMAAPPPYQQQAHVDPYNRPPPPPQYTQSPQYNQPPPPQGYFGGQQTGIELQSPPNAYGGERVYQPPPGPPPPNGKP
ncbi:chitin synthesis regulation, resistance to congo red-domain-containing protein [Aspergillus cavernicola]|uniref:Chitin synthesis regulation, resistance to congo red-domain-containing protein n=1 Tax=Aspergillus cavernicola TaxID=176166 RepID=A0ABR4IHU4_9EURO